MYRGNKPKTKTDPEGPCLTKRKKKKRLVLMEAQKLLFTSYKSKHFKLSVYYVLMCISQWVIDLMLYTLG